MQNIRQARRKENSLSFPTTSLHLTQISKLIQQYQHSRMLYGINMNTGAVQSTLVEKDVEECFNLLLDVPYIQSQHYESKQTFADNQSEEPQNFTDEEQNGEDTLERHRKVVLEDLEDDFRKEDFQFVKHGNKESKGTFAYNSTVYTESQEQREPFDDDVDIYRLQETAHFSQAPQPNFEYRTNSFSSKENNRDKLNRTTNVVIEKEYNDKGVSRKAMFLNKIQREKSRKEIVQEINKQRHHIKKFLK